MSPDTDGSPSSFTPSFGAALAARVRPRSVHRSMAGGRPGLLAGRLVDFAGAVAVAPLARVDLEPTTIADPGHESVRPPIDPWLWGDTDGDVAEIAPATPWRAARTTVRRTPRRGLPLTTRRGRRTVGGDGTAPGAIARRLLPDASDAAPPDASRLLAAARGHNAAASERATVRRAPAPARSAAPPDEAPALPSDLIALQRMLVRGGLMEPRSPEAGVGQLPPSIARSAPPAPDARPETASRVSAAGSIDRSTVAARRPAPTPPAPSASATPTPTRTSPTPTSATAPTERGEVRGPDAVGPRDTPRPPAPPQAAAIAAAPTIDRDTVMRAMRGRSDARRAASAPAHGAARTSVAAPAPGVTGSATATGPATATGSAAGRPGGSAGALPPAGPAPVVRRSAIADSVIDARAATRPGGATPSGAEPARRDSSTVLLERDEDAPFPSADPITPAQPSVQRAAPLDDAGVAPTPAAAAAAARAAAAERPVAERLADERTAATPRPTNPIVRRLAEVAPSVADVRVETAREATSSPVARSTSPVAPAPAPAARTAPGPATGPASVPGARDVAGVPPTVRPPSPAVAPADGGSAAPTLRRSVAEAPAAAPSTAPATAPPSAPPTRRAGPDAPTTAPDRNPASPGDIGAPVDRAARPDRPMPDRNAAAAPPAPATPPGVGDLPVRPAAVPTPVAPADTVRRTVEATASAAEPAPARAPGSDRVTASDLRRLRRDEGTNANRSPASPLPRALAADTLASPTATATGSVPTAPSPGVAALASPVTGRPGADGPGASPALPSVRPAAAAAPGAFGAPSAGRATRETVRRSPAEPIRRRPTPLASAGIASVAGSPGASGASGASEYGLMDAIARDPAGDAPIADRFMAELSRTRAPRPAPLPERLRPMADLIAGGATPRVSHDVVSRQALRSVGKVAATVGDVIHVDRPLHQVSTEVLAHELTHVAHPSTAPRFFADDRPSAEERRAETIGKLMRSTAPAVIRRAPSQDAPSSSGSPGTISAAALADQITGTGGDTVIRRWNTATPRGAGRSGAPLATDRRGGSGGAPAPAPQQTVAPAPVPAPPPAEQVAAAPDLVEQFDRILELLEERVLRELERRGGRLRGGF